MNWCQPIISRLAVVTIAAYLVPSHAGGCARLAWGWNSSIAFLLSKDVFLATVKIGESAAILTRKPQVVTLTDRFSVLNLLRRLRAPPEPF